MTWTQFNDGSGIIGFIGSAFATIGVIYGIIVAGWRINVSNFKERLGAISFDAELMSYFVAGKPRPWNIWPISQPTVDPPRLPNVFALIEAGDLGLFTSSMFSSMPASYTRVSWMPVYEAFFREYVWSSEMRGHQDFGVFGADDKDKTHHLLNYVERARRDMLKTKLNARRNDTLREKISVWLVNHKHWQWLYFRHQPSPSLVDHTPKVLEISLDPKKIWDIDPHLLYYKWHLDPRPNKRANAQRLARNDGECHVKDFPEEPLLISSFIPPRPLKEVLLGDLTSEIPNKFEWTTNHSQIWIHDAKPCVEVFDGELAALSVILGVMQPRVEKKLLKDQDLRDDKAKDWRGAFGTVLTMGKKGHYNTLRLVHSQRDQKDLLGGGRGYSTLFAKHMACGCLPFGISFTSGGRVVASTITLAPDWEESLRFIKKYELTDTAFDKHVPAGAKYLLSISIAPSSVCNFPENTWFGDEIYEPMDNKWDFIVTKTSIAEKPWRKVGTWSDAVAGIAFGGLVPVAADYLKDAVACTVGVDDSRLAKDLDDIVALMQTISKHADRTVDLRITYQNEAENHFLGVPLFGKDLQKLDDVIYKSGVYGEEDEWLGDPIGRISAKAEVMGRFTVLLEYLIARSGDVKESNHTSKSTSAPKADEKQPSARIAETTSSAGTEAPSGLDPRVQQVFWHCAEKIRQEMNKKRIKEELKQKKTEMNQAEEKERKQEEIGEKIEKDQAQEEESEPEGSDKSNPDTVLQHLGRKFYQEFLDMGGKGCLPTNPYRLTVEECGWVAWHLIKAWTAVVQGLSWPKGEDIVQAPGIQADKPNPTDKEKNEVETRKYWPPQLDEMSYVSAWV